MKNLLTKSLALMFVLGVTATFTACHNGEDVQLSVVNNASVEEADESGNVVGRTLVINSNKTATFTLGSQAPQSGSKATFTNAPAKGTVTVKAGSTTKSVKFSFDDATNLEYDVIFESEGTAVSQAAAQAGTTTVSNAGANATETGVTAEMDFDGAVNENAAVTGDYSVTVVNPTETETTADQLESKEGKTDAIQEPVLSLDCKPDGADFSSKPIKVKVNVPNSADYDLACTNSETDEAASSFTQSGDNMTIELSHFSIWDIILKATVTKVEKSTIETTVSGDANQGYLTYSINYGFDTNNTDAIVSKYLKKVFGVSKKAINKRAKFTKVAGTANLKVSQQVKIYTIKSGNKTFTATVYGKANLNLSIETATPEEVKTHGGGTN